MLMHNGNRRYSYEALWHAIISRAIALELNSMVRLHFQSLKSSHIQTFRHSALLNAQIKQTPTEIAQPRNNVPMETNPSVVFFSFSEVSAAADTTWTQLR